MQVFDNRLEVYVGGGITKDSQPKSEWEETQRKAETMQQVL
jgi:isochorismate synthase